MEDPIGEVSEQQEIRDPRLPNSLPRHDEPTGL
jgi:hypothetical protein